MDQKKQLPFLTVAAVTFSSGEEIGIYTTLFVTNYEVGTIIILISVVMMSTAFWCFLADYLVKLSFLANVFRSIGSRVLLPNGIEVKQFSKYGILLSQNLNDQDLWIVSFPVLTCLKLQFEIHSLSI